MKFGKQLQKRQLEIPEYASHFVNYKGLKKLIRRTTATPILAASNESPNVRTLDSPSGLQASKATFFFQLERELEKVNAFYLQKEDDLNVRVKMLLDKQKLLHSQGVARRSAKFTALEEGFQQFAGDLNKLQKYIEINGIAFSKILKKWDKTSKSKTKELYLSRAVEVQPFFNAKVISGLSDQVTISLQELAAWKEDEGVYEVDRVITTTQLFAGKDEGDADNLLLDTVLAGNIESLRDLLARMHAALSSSSADCDVSLIERVTRIFLTSIHAATWDALQVLLDSGLVDVQSQDDINRRNCLHQAAIYGSLFVLEDGLLRGVSATRIDVYGRVPLHYASIHGRLDMLDALIAANPDMINLTDHDNFTPLIHTIIHGRFECAERLLSQSARVDPPSDKDHVPLNLACERGSVAMVDLLLRHGASIIADTEGLFPQHIVARSQQPAQLLLLLRDRGANLDQLDRLYGWTPLFHAASEGNVDALQALLNAGVSLNILDEKKLPPMYYAALEGHLECMKLLASRGESAGGPALGTVVRAGPRLGALGSSGLMPTTSLDPDAIPPLKLPPPIIPLRRYGHNFLDTKTVVQITFDDQVEEPAVLFFQNGKYPAARLTISSKIVADLIPKNIILPFQDDTRLVSFQVDHLDSFTLDFDVFPTYGARFIAKTVMLPGVLKYLLNSSCTCCLPLFDPRLRAIGQVKFQAHVIKPFRGKPLEMTDFETYWKATSLLGRQPSTVVTGSSLSGDHVRLYIQYTADCCPVLWPHWTVCCGGVEVPVCRLTAAQFDAITSMSSSRTRAVLMLSQTGHPIDEMCNALAEAGVGLLEALATLPAEVHVNLHLLFPSPEEERELGVSLEPYPDVNTFVDAVLTVVFDHARAQRAQVPHAVRSIVFSSYSSDLCTALNWKQPNFPVFLCNELGGEKSWPQRGGRRSTSIKEAVRIAQGNNFMGLICCGRLLDMVPELIRSIKSHGLALVTDTTSDLPGPKLLPTDASSPQLPDGIDGVLRSPGILSFTECLDM